MRDTRQRWTADDLARVREAFRAETGRAPLWWPEFLAWRCQGAADALYAAAVAELLAFAAWRRGGCPWSVEHAENVSEGMPPLEGPETIIAKGLGVWLEGRPLVRRGHRKPETLGAGQLLVPGRMAGMEPAALEWIVRGLIPAGHVTMLIGSGGGGKSLVALQLCFSLAVGARWLGFDVPCAPSLYISAEDDGDEVHRRLSRIAAGHGVSLAAAGDMMAVRYVRGCPDLLLGRFHPESGAWIASEFMEKIEAECVERGAELLVLDNVAHLFPGNENIRGEVTRFVAALDGLAMKLGMAVLLIGHPAKADGSEFSGSTAWEAAVRSRLLLGRPKGVDGGDVRVLQGRKSNYGALDEGHRIVWHNGMFWREADAPCAPARAQAERARADALDALFLELLAEATAGRRALSASRQAATWAPKMLKAMRPECAATVDDLTGAMERLLATGRLVARAPLWRGADRKQVFGLALPPDLFGTADDDGADAEGDVGW